MYLYRAVDKAGGIQIRLPAHALGNVPFHPKRGTQLRLILLVTQSAALFAILAFLDKPLVAAEAVLTIRSNNRIDHFSTSDLLKRSDLETVTVQDDPAYPGKTRTYRAIKVANLITEENLSKNTIYSLKANDGFAAPIAGSQLLNTLEKSAIAYIAIEVPTEPWPPIAIGKPSAGPFYLIWKNSKLSKISQEEWPYMLVAIEEQGSGAATYPEIFPVPALAKGDPVMLGMEVFIRNCFACHTINNSGAGQLGPDLNIPMNPTEYFQESALRILIRNPQNLRKWPNSRMIGFSEKILPERDLEHLLAYLRQMAKQRPKK
jgi:mono/diheme cytochrome c family protein